jgi:Flp pilus assembly protein TadB
MDEQQETYGRYCLPVYEDPPLTVHPAYRPALVAWLLLYVMMIASHHGIIRVGHGLQVAIDLMFIAGAIGILILLVWIRKDNRRARRGTHMAGGSAG